MRFRLKHLSTTFLRYSALALAGLVGSSCLKAEGTLLSKSASAGGAITHAAALASDDTLYFGTRNASYGSGANLYSFKGASLASIANAQDDADGFEETVFLVKEIPRTLPSRISPSWIPFSSILYIVFLMMRRSATTSRKRS